jgi:hypothetical protein
MTHSERHESAIPDIPDEHNYSNERSQILEEIDQKSQFSSQQITIVKAQLASKAREQRMLQLTASEVGSLPQETHIYEGVGKM